MVTTVAEFTPDWIARRELLFLNLEREPVGYDWCTRHTEIADEIVRTVYEAVHEAFPDVPPIAIVATGGYGRAEMAPYSDIDLSVVPLEENHPHMDGAVRMFFRHIHGVFGGDLRMQVGYNYRLIADAPGLDAKSRTGLLDARLVAGSYLPFQSLMDNFWDTFPVGEFLIAKLLEREQLFKKTNDTPLAVEPNLKDGAGGLRCFQTANWLGAAIGERPLRMTSEYEAVLRMRNLLHLASGRNLNQLSRVRQEELADRQGEDLFAMTSSLAASLGSLHDRYIEAREKLHEARYRLNRHVHAMRGDARIEGGSPAQDAASGIALATRLGLRVSAIPASTSPVTDPGPVLFTVRSGESTLRNLDRCRVLGALLPELDATRYLMPRDASHSYTVFEHTLRTVRNLDYLIAGEDWYAEIAGTLRDLGPLYVAALLHDVGKIDPDLPHSDVGAAMARRAAERWRLEASTTEDIVWLVQEHLTMARFMRIRDISHPDTVREFANLVENRDRLTMLALLTRADIDAVGPGSWTPVQEAFLHELYERTHAALEEGETGVGDPEPLRRRAARRLQKDEVPEVQIAAFVDRLPAHYLYGTPSETIRVHFGLVQRALMGEVSVLIEPKSELEASDVTICGIDRHGLLSDLLGVLYALDLSLVGLRACTTETEVPIALDVFTVTFGGRRLPDATAAQVMTRLKGVLRQETRVEDLLRAKGKDPDQRQVIVRATFQEGAPGVLEVRVPRGRGVPFRLSRWIAANRWDIQTARVGQWAGQGAAAFYLYGEGHRVLPAAEVEAALRSFDDEAEAGV